MATNYLPLIERLIVGAVEDAILRYGENYVLGRSGTKLSKADLISMLRSYVIYAVTSVITSRTEKNDSISDEVITGAIAGAVTGAIFGYVTGGVSGAIAGAITGAIEGATQGAIIGWAKERQAEDQTGETEGGAAAAPSPKPEWEIIQTPESSWIVTVIYSKIKSKLQMRTKEGKVYTCDEITSDVWEALKIAPSKGQFFTANIKDEKSSNVWEALKGEMPSKGRFFTTGIG